MPATPAIPASLRGAVAPFLRAFIGADPREIAIEAARAFARALTGAR